MSETVRFVLAVIFIVMSMTCFAIAVWGVFRFKFILNRMQAAAIIDTLGLLFLLLALILLAWDMGFIPKLILILAFQWIGSPITAHMVSRMEAETDRSLSDHMDIIDETEEGKE